MSTIQRALIVGMGTFGVIQAAMAFAPSEDVFQGIEPHRVFQVHAYEQVRLQRSAAWSSFVAGEGSGWQVRFDEVTGTPHRAWGTGIDLGQLDDAADVEKAFGAFLLRHADLFGVEAGALKVRSVVYEANVDTWYVDVDVIRGGAAVYRGGVTARIKHDRLIMVGADTYPTTPIRSGFDFGSSEAIAAAIAAGPYPAAAHTGMSVRPLMLPWDDGAALHLRSVYEVRSSTQSPRGEWVHFVDAVDGELLSVHNEVRFMEGTVSALHDERHPGGELVESPLAGVIVSNGTDTAAVDEDGLFSIDDAESYDADLQGREVRVYNSAGDEGSVVFTEPDVLFTDADATMAELDTYVFLTQARTYWRTYATGIRWAEGGTVRAFVNENDACNAFFDGDVNFFKAAGGCNNTGRIADVVYHEWGHGLHAAGLRAGTFDGSFSEGVSDTIAFLMTGDNIISPYFSTNGSGIRDVSPNRVYPDDYVNNESMVHSNGLIFGGAVWDTWAALEDSLGDAEEARSVTSAIVMGTIYGGPTVEESFDEALSADDDDGDLSNGTPHACELVDAFGLHGLGPAGGSGGALLGHEPVQQAHGGAVIPLDIAVVNPMPACLDVEAKEAAAVFRVDGGEWEQRDLDVDGDVSGVIPSQALGSFVEYYVKVEDASGDVYTTPEAGKIAPFSFYVGGVIPVHCDDFEDHDGGYVHELVEGPADEDGADDWQWGRPRGASWDPSMAHSGRKVWGNDLGDDNYNGEYQNDRFNRLTSPEFSLGHYDGTFLHYWRWLSVEDGVFDRATVLVDGEPAWTNWGSNENRGGDHTVDRQWMPHSLSLGDAADDRTVQFSFELQSDGGLSFGGWTLDDICVMAPDTRDNRLGVGDFNVANDEASRASLSWTNPRHAPVERVVVVRNSSYQPLHFEDGIIVWDDTEPELGALMTIRDETAYEKNGPEKFYAVFAFDGEEWLGFSVAGLNADNWNGPFTDAEPGSERGAPGSSGCGCASTGPANGLLAGLPFLLIGLARRRR